MNKFIICFMTMVFGCLASHAQIIHDLQGKPYMEQSYTEVEGNPFLINSWAAAPKIVQLNTRKIDFRREADASGSLTWTVDSVLNRGTLGY